MNDQRKSRRSSGFRAEEVQLLVTDPVPDLPADQPQRRLDVAKQGLDQGGLAAAAFPGNPVDLVFLNLEIDLVDRLDDLLDAEHVQDVRGFQLLYFDHPHGAPPYLAPTRWMRALGIEVLADAHRQQVQGHEEGDRGPDRGENPPPQAEEDRLVIEGKVEHGPQGGDGHIGQAEIGQGHLHAGHPDHVADERGQRERASQRGGTR